MGTVGASGAAGRRLLLVDDDGLVREMLTLLLEEAGYQVEPVADGADAVAKLGGAAYDLVLTDYQMPRMDGLALLAVCRRTWPAMPVLVLSGIEIGGLACELGAAGWIRKPFHIGTVLQVIGTALRPSSNPAAGRRPLPRAC